MPSRLHHFLSLFALFAASFSMVVEPALNAMVESPDQLWADTDSDADGDDDDSADDESLLTEKASLADSFTLECRVTLLSNVTTSSRNLDGDPRGPPTPPARMAVEANRPRIC
jgi:hypothetical protein